MPTLHMLPGESRGDTAEIVLNTAALELLMATLKEARDGNSFACARFNQRDEGQFTLCIDIVDKPHHHRDWTDRPFSYLRHQIRHVRYDSNNRPYDADLLATDLYAARHAKRHSQTEAAEIIGLSRNSLSFYENGRKAPRSDTWEMLCAYMGTTPARYFLRS